MKNMDIYLHGMTLVTTSHLLRDSFPVPDQYAEISKTYSFPGGETGFGYYRQAHTDNFRQVRCVLWTDWLFSHLGARKLYTAVKVSW